MGVRPESLAHTSYSAARARTWPRVIGPIRTAAFDDVNVTEMRGVHALVKRMKLTYMRRMGWS